MAPSTKLTTMNKTTFPSYEPLKMYFTVWQTVILMVLSVLLGVIGTIGEQQHKQRNQVRFVTMQGSVYYCSEHKGVIVTYWRNGEAIGNLDHVQSAVCRNLCEADSITIKTPWP